MLAERCERNQSPAGRLAEHRRLCRLGILVDVEANCGEFGRETQRGGADALERGVQRIGRAAVGLDVVDGGLRAGNAELGAEEVGHGLRFGLARDVVGTCAAVGRRSNASLRYAILTTERETSSPTTLMASLPRASAEHLNPGSHGLHDNYGSALAAQPVRSQGRPATDRGSRLIVWIGLPTLDVLPDTPDPEGRTLRRSSRLGPDGTGQFLSVTKKLEAK